MLPTNVKSKIKTHLKRYVDKSFIFLFNVYGVAISRWIVITIQSIRVLAVSNSNEHQ